MTKILFFAGSTSSTSINRKLAHEAERVAKDMGVQTTFLDLADYPLPIFDADCEKSKGAPENAKKLKDILLAHDGVFVASPEYNSSFTPLLKNAIDWVSRVRAEGQPDAFAGKVYAIGAVSPGALGGYRGLIPLRLFLSNIGIHVVPSQVAVSGGEGAFDAEGRLKDDFASKMLSKVIGELALTAKALASAR